jgi:1-acyl-sn-glycerol-3-phosphate acyltransferase
MYLELNVPVVPVALDSGLYWSRKSLVLWPGVARARFLPAIPPGLSGEEFRQRLVGAIEGETNRLILEAYDRGLDRPVAGELATRLRRLADGHPPKAVEAPQPTTS